MKRKILLISLVASLVLLVSWVQFEGVMVSAVTSSGDVDVTLTVTEEISLTVPSSNLSMTALTMTTNSSTNAAGGAAWNVKTNSQDGWSLTLRSDQTSALADATTSEAFTDYTAASSSTPETWAVTNAYEFGFSVNGSAVSTGTWGTGTDCSTGTNVKYRGFASTSVISVATSGTETGTSGVDTDLCVKAEQNGLYAPNGVYVADVFGTVTSTP